MRYYLLLTLAAPTTAFRSKKNTFWFWPANTSLPTSRTVDVTLFRHLEKTGGVSLRHGFQHSRCQYFGYQLYGTTMYRIERFVHNYTHYSTRTTSTATSW